MLFSSRPVKSPYYQHDWSLLMWILIMWLKQCLSGFFYSSLSILYVLLGICHFSKGVWFLLLQNSIRNQDLGTRYTHCYRGVLVSRPSQFTEQDVKCVHTNTCMYTYLPTFLYVIIYIYIELIMALYWYLQH